MITLKEYYMGRDAAYPLELTDELRSNAQDLLERVNQLLDHMDSLVVRSGWRPASVNLATPHASMRSKHITCQAIDLADNSGKVTKWVMNNLDMCDKMGLWVEAPEFTPTWLHLQSVPPKSGHRVFIP